MRNWFLFFLIFLPIISSGQEDYEDLLEIDQEVSKSSAFLERLEDLRKSPIDINTASPTDLQQIPWISPVVALRIVSYRRTKMYKSMQDLKSVEGIDDELLKRITPFLCVQKAKKLPEIGGRFRSRIMDTKPQGESYFRGNYSPYPHKIYDRLLMNYGSEIDAGVLIKKDPGEKNLADLLLYYAAIHNTPFIDKLAIGNFKIEFGQGLVLFWPGQLLTKSGEVITPVKKKPRGFSPYMSTLNAEMAPLYGIGCEKKIMHTNLYLFWTDSKLDASINDNETVKNLYSQGYHRTESEIAKKDLLEENLFGGHITWGNIGATFYTSSYKPEFNPPIEQNSFYAFRGKRNTVYGVDFDSYIKNINLFGEGAISRGNGRGFVIGAITDFDKLDLVWVVRNYDKDFYNLRNCGFGDDVDAINEKGYFMGMRFKPRRGTKFWAYYDQFRFPWRTYYEKLPVRGDELYFKLDQRLARDFVLTIREKIDRSDESKTIGDWSKNLYRKRDVKRIEVNYNRSRKISMRVRYENTRIRFEGLPNIEKGNLIYGGVNYIPAENMKIYSRVIFFSTSSYDARLYEYENDLPGILETVMLNGSGRRWWVMLKENFSPEVQLTIKYTNTKFYNASFFGSGGDVKYGDTQSEYKIGLDIEW